MRSQTVRAVEAILEADPGISENQRGTFMRVLRGEQTAPSGIPIDLVAQITKAVERFVVQKAHLRREEAAEYLGCSTRQIDEMKHNGDLPFSKFGKRLIIFKRTDLDRIMNEKRIDIDDVT